MELQRAILHRITKQSGETGPASIHVDCRDSELPADELTEKSAEAIRSIYARVINGYGVFSSDEETYRFPAILRLYVDGNLSFVDFSTKACHIIGRHMQSQALATGGFIFFADYQHAGNRWVLIASLKLREGAGVDEEDLSLHETLSLDIDRLHEAARINVSKWLSDSQPYLSFIKKRQGQAVVSQYFREALACTEYTDAKHYTSQALNALERFWDEREIDQGERIDLRRSVYDYFEEKRRAKKPINLQVLSARAYEEDPNAFRDFARESGYEISDTFRPHRDTYLRFKRIKGKMGSVNISFDVSDLTRERVFFDREHGQLVVRELSQSLIDEINLVLPGDSE